MPKDKGTDYYSLKLEVLSKGRAKELKDIRNEEELKIIALQMKNCLDPDYTFYLI